MKSKMHSAAKPRNTTGTFFPLPAVGIGDSLTDDSEKKQKQDEGKSPSNGNLMRIP